MKPEDARKQNLFPREHHDAIKNSDLTSQTSAKFEFHCAAARTADGSDFEVRHEKPRNSPECAASLYPAIT